MSFPFFYRVNLATLLLTAMSACLPDPSRAQELNPDVRRLPNVAAPDTSPETPRRLPALPPETGPVDQGVDQDVVIFAAGAVEASVPVGWKVTEVPTGRELRFWMTPVSNPADQPPNEGIWMAYHWLDRPARQNEIMDFLELRVPTGSNPAAVATETMQLKTTTPNVTTALLRQYQHKDRTGFHLAIGMSHGILEVAVEATTPNYPALRQTALEVLAGMKLSEPDLRTAVVSPPLAAARQVVGLWKGLRASMKLGGDGRVVIQFDRKNNYPLDESGNLNYGQRISRLTGNYRAEDDMLFVQWDDGSRLNYRWRLDNGRLLLTDHNGRVSQLHRLIQ